MTARRAAAATTDMNPIRRILLVDPDIGLRKALGLMLKLSGYEVHHVGDGRAAIAMHQIKPFDIIITEMVMPEIGGLEILLLLQEHPPVPKFIFLSRKSRVAAEAFSRMASKMGAEHLPKPFRPQQLLTLVRQVLAEE